MADTSYDHLFQAVERLLNESERTIIAIDGRCGSGKSTLAKEIAQRYNGHIFSMDDFFLPKAMRTKERLAEPGGNVHYERFLKEVLQPLRDQQSITYRPYNCQIQSFEKSINKEPKKFTIVEGVYALHPTLQSAFDLKVFLTVDRNEQYARIRKRNGAEQLTKFINRWIPLEELYFTTFHLKESCDFVIDTTDM